MKVLPLALDGLVLIEPTRHQDARGFFMETFRESAYRDAGIHDRFVQDNWSRSARNVLRGLHFQKRQGKLVTVVRGEIFDVAVDIRPDSESFGRWAGSRLSAENGLQLYLPPGFAHGFCVVSDGADVWYKTTDIYRPEEEGGLLWNDPELAIEWPVADPALSPRDRTHPTLAALDRSRLAMRGENDA